MSAASPTSSVVVSTDPKAPRKYGVVIAACVAYVLVAIGVAVLLILGFHGNASTDDLKQQTKRRDCITTLATARNAVFQNVDIYKAIQIEQLSTALLNAQSGQRATADQIKAFADNDAKLKMALEEARRLQPASTLDDLILRGGTVAGKHYDACPG